MDSTISFDISAVLGIATPKIRVAAVGAMFIAEGDEPHEALMARGLCEVVGFEPHHGGKQVQDGPISPT